MGEAVRTNTDCRFIFVAINKSMVYYIEYFRTNDAKMFVYGTGDKP